MHTPPQSVRSVYCGTNSAEAPALRTPCVAQRSQSSASSACHDGSPPARRQQSSRAMHDKVRAHSADARATHWVFGDVIVASATVWPWTSSSAIQTAAVKHGTAHRCWRPSHTCAGGSRSLFVAPVRNHFSESTDIGCTLCVAANVKWPTLG